MKGNYCWAALCCPTHPCLLYMPLLRSTITHLAPPAMSPHHHHHTPHHSCTPSRQAYSLALTHTPPCFPLPHRDLAPSPPCSQIHHPPVAAASPRNMNLYPSPCSPPPHPTHTRTGKTSATTCGCCLLHLLQETLHCAGSNAGADVRLLIRCCCCRLRCCCRGCSTAAAHGDSTPLLLLLLLLLLLWGDRPTCAGSCLVYCCCRHRGNLAPALRGTAERPERWLGGCAGPLLQCGG